MFDLGSRRLHKSLNIEHVGAVYDCPNQVRKGRADRANRLIVGQSYRLPRIKSERIVRIAWIAEIDCPNQVRKDRADRVDRGDRLPKSSPCSHRLHLQWESESDWERGAQTLNIEHVGAVGAVYDRPNQVRNIIA